MALPKGIASIAHLQRRALDQRGGQSAQVDSWDRSKPDALALWRDAYLDSLAARNYSEGTLEGRRDALKVFLIWAQERELIQAGQIPVRSWKLTSGGSGATPRPMENGWGGARSDHGWAP
jgi:hypothetical protein